MGVAPFNIDPLEKYLLLIPTALGSGSLEVLSCKGKNASTRRDNNDFIEVEVYHLAILGSS